MIPATMILGLSTPVFTAIHVALSLIGIATGFALIFGLICGKLHSRTTMVFLITTTLTSLTGFAFPNTTLTPGIIFGILSVLVLLPASAALYIFSLSGPWRAIFVITASLAQYFNCFVLIAQAFKHGPVLSTLAPAQAKPIFLTLQVLLLLLMIGLTTAALKHCKPRQPSA